MRTLFRQFSFPGGVSSHASPECPGSLHEGGEPRLLAEPFVRREVRQPRSAGRVRRRRRRGRERAAGHGLACRTSSSTPRPDGAVLPILHLNGYKIANPPPCSRIPRCEELAQPAQRIRLGAPVRRGRRSCGDARADGHGARRVDRAHPRDPGGGAPARREVALAPLADDRAGVAEAAGRGPRRSTAEAVEGTFRAHQVPIPTRAAMPPTSPSSNSGCAATDPKNSSTPPTGCAANSCRRRHRWETDAWARTRTRMPTAARCCATWNCPTSGCYDPGRAAGRLGPRRHRGPRRVQRRHHPLQRGDPELPRVFGPDETLSAWAARCSRRPHA